MKNKPLLLLWAGFLIAGLVACGIEWGSEKGGVIEGNSSEPESSAMAGYTWQRVGGIAGFCDVVIITADGMGTVQSCHTQPPEIRGEIPLTTDQTARLNDWVQRFGSFTHEESDPAVADAMTITIVFTGRGRDQPIEPDFQAMENLALEVMRIAGQSE
ncbi:MAG: hypothetical protein R6X18_03350 [Chloroflexota bacterium]|jgi:hypothetical protein